MVGAAAVCVVRLMINGVDSEGCDSGSDIGVTQKTSKYYSFLKGLVSNNLSLLKKWITVIYHYFSMYVN